MLPSYLVLSYSPQSEPRKPAGGGGGRTRAQWTAVSTRRGVQAQG